MWQGLASTLSLCGRGIKCHSGSASVRKYTTTLFAVVDSFIIANVNL